MKHIYLNYTIKTLASAYYPWLCPDSASQRLRRMLKSAPDVLNDLHRAGFHPRQRNLTQRQLQIIFDYLGIPELIVRYITDWQHQLKN